MKRHIVAMVKMAMWYEAEIAPSRVSFAGGVVAGTFIALVLGLLNGFNHDSAVWSAIISVVMFIVTVFFAGALFKIGKRYGDRRPICDILKEVEKEGGNISDIKTPTSRQTELQNSIDSLVHSMRGLDRAFEENQKLNKELEQANERLNSEKTNT
jgi:hypothetical protein